MLDEPDNTAKLNAADSSVYRSCIGVLLYISSDYTECQYTIRGLSQSMASPTVQAMACLRHLGQYLLVCIDHATMLKYEAHQGLLHYNPCDYTLEVYSGSDWAKHNKHVDLFLQDLCFCLDVYFTPLRDHRRHWHFPQHKLRYMQLSLQLAMQS